MGKRSNKHRIVYILYTILVIQVFFLIYANFKYMKHMVDYDSSTALEHAIQMWEQKKLFISNWGYQTTLELDSTVGIVALIYGITKNIFLSQAIGNTLLILSYYYIIRKIAKSLEASDTAFCISAMLLFLPYTLGQLGYLPMLFSGPAFYSVRGLIVLIMLSILLDIDKNVKNCIPRMVFIGISTWLCGISSGIYVAMCYLFPFLVFELIKIVFDGDIKQFCNRRIMVIIFAMVAMFFGVVCGKILNVQVNGNISSKILCNNKNWIDNIQSCFVGIFELFGGVALEDNVKLFSIEGIHILLKFAIVCIFIFSIIEAVRYCKKNKHIELIDGYVFSMIFVNMTVLCLLYTKYGSGTFEYRYHLIPMMLVIIQIMPQIDRILHNENKLLKTTILGLLILIISGATLLSDIKLCQIKKYSRVNLIEETTEYLEENGYDLVVVVGDDNVLIGREMRVFSSKVNYIITGDDIYDIGPTSWGGSTEFLDISSHNGKIGIICAQDKYTDVPQIIKSGLVLKKQFDYFNIYEMTSDNLDWVSGPPVSGDESIDIPNTLGYFYDNSYIDETGKLISNGNEACILWGPYYSGIEGNWNYTVNYKILSGEQSPVFEIVENQKVVYRMELGLNNTSITLDNITFGKNDSNIENRIWNPEGTVVEIESITINRER